MISGYNQAIPAGTRAASATLVETVGGGDRAPEGDRADPAPTPRLRGLRAARRRRVSSCRGLGDGGVGVHECLALFGLGFRMTRARVFGGRMVAAGGPPAAITEAGGCPGTGTAPVGTWSRSSGRTVLRGNAKRVRSTGPGTSAFVRHPCSAHRCAAAARAARTRSRTVAVLSSSPETADRAVIGTCGPAGRPGRAAARTAGPGSGGASATSTRSRGRAPGRTGTGSRPAAVGTGRVADRALGAGQPDLALLQRGAQRVQQVRGPLGSLVDEEQAPVSQCWLCTPRLLGGLGACPELARPAPSREACHNAAATTPSPRAEFRFGGLSRRWRGAALARSRCGPNHRHLLSSVW